MEDDIFLSTAIDLFKGGVWNEETFRRQVLTHAKESGLDEKAVNDLLIRVIPVKDFTLEDKRNFLRNVKFKNGDLKYPNAVDDMPDVTVEKIFEAERKSLSDDEIRKIIKNEIEEKEDKKAEQQKKETKVEIVNPILDRLEVPNEKKETSKKEETKVEVVNNPILNRLEVPKEKSEEQPKEETKVEVVSNPILNRLEVPKEKEETSKLVIPKIELPKVEEKKENPVLERLKVKTNNEEVKEPIKVDDSEIKTNPILDRLVPETNEEFENIHKNTTNPEKDSSVRKVEASPERIEKLKKKKSKVINYFIKGAIIVTTVLLLHPMESIPLIGGYLYLSGKIQDGTFNPKTKAGKAAKNIVESIMNIGMGKEEERGKTK